MKWLGHLLFILLFLLVTFFGLGPVVYADGSVQERLITALIVTIIYAILIFLYRKFMKWTAKK
jgi:hypothetical protein